MKRLYLSAISLTVLISACARDVEPEAPVDLQPPEILGFSAEPEAVAPGATSRLTWEVRGTVALLEVTAEDLYSPIDVTEKDFYAARPTVTTTYVLRARNPAGADERQVTVEVVSEGQ
jgi:hypothetical protein